MKKISKNNQEAYRIIQELVLATDAYKLTHIDQYPDKTTHIFSYFSMRGPKKSEKEFIFNRSQSLVVGHIDYLLQKLHEHFFAFFALPREKVQEILTHIDQELDWFIGKKHLNKNNWLALYDLQKLPIDFYYLPIKYQVNFNEPFLVLLNNDPKFYWLVNFLETNLLTSVWKLVTTTNVAYNLKLLGEEYAKKTGVKFSPLQFHDFSFRGMSSYYSAVLNGIAHLTYFDGSDTLPAVFEYKNYIDFKRNFKSIPATEHSIMISFGPGEGENLVMEKLLKTYPEGYLSIVADSFNYFNFLEEILPKYKEKILKRNGKIVIRPDSGEPLKIILKSLIILGEIFGYQINQDGFKLLNPKIGLIFGDSLNPKMIKEILEMMFKEKWASSNIVFGIGSSTYVNFNRDSLGFVFKSSCIKIAQNWRKIYKKPETDNFKKSLSGIVYLDKKGNLVKEGNIEDFLNPKKNLLQKFIYKNNN